MPISSRPPRCVLLRLSRLPGAADAKCSAAAGSWAPFHVRAEARRPPEPVPASRVAPAPTPRRPRRPPREAACDDGWVRTHRRCIVVEKMHATPTYAQQEQRRTAPARRPRRVPSRKPENHGRRPEPESNRHQLRSYSASAALVARVEVARRGRSSYDTGLFHLLITSLSKRHLTARLSAILSRSGETPPSWQRLAPERLQSPGWVSMAFIRPSRCHSRPPSPATSLNIAWVVGFGFGFAKIVRSLKATNWPVSSQNCKNTEKRIHFY